jgi:glycosyltransferase involved in cell wall biosynthesis
MCLESLQKQTLPANKWELLIIDNACSTPIEVLPKEYQLENCRVIRETNLGLTRARLCGIRNSISELIVLVDDDAVLDSSYLATALQISHDYPFIGAFGGNIELKFLTTPPEWSKPHWPKLAEREITTPVWSNFNSHPSTLPWGVGMCIKRQVAIHYFHRTISDVTRIDLDRIGTSLVSGGDDDLARTSYDLKLATGLFPQLHLFHQIPPHRLTEDYLANLTEAQSYSGHILNWLYGSQAPQITQGKFKSILGYIRRCLTHKRRDRLFAEAKARGRQRAAKQIMQYQKTRN